MLQGVCSSERKRGAKLLFVELATFRGVDAVACINYLPLRSSYVRNVRWRGSPSSLVKTPVTKDTKSVCEKWILRPQPQMWIPRVTSSSCHLVYIYGFLGNLKTLGQQTQPPENFPSILPIYIYFILLFSFPSWLPLPTAASTNLVLGWNSWPSGATTS